MFKEGDLVKYKSVTGKVIFSCEYSLSILVGDEFPRRHQCRVVVYSHEWDQVKLLSDSSENVTQAKSQLMNRPQFPPQGPKWCIVNESSGFWPKWHKLKRIKWSKRSMRLLILTFQKNQMTFWSMNFVMHLIHFVLWRSENCPLIPQRGSKSCIVVSSSKTTWLSPKDSSHQVTFSTLRTLIIVTSRPTQRVFCTSTRREKTRTSGIM